MEEERSEGSLDELEVGVVVVLESRREKVFLRRSRTPMLVVLDGKSGGGIGVVDGLEVVHRRPRGKVMSIRIEEKAN
jgi:hypothetical protein